MPVQFSTNQNARRVVMIQTTAELMGWPLSPEATAVMVRDLGNKSDTQIEKGLENLRREESGRLTLQKILAALPADRPVTPPAFRLEHTPAPPTPWEGPDMDDAAVAEAHRRVTARINGHIWAALQDITEERKAGGMQTTEAAGNTAGTPLPPRTDGYDAFRKDLPPNPHLDVPDEAA